MTDSHAEGTAAPPVPTEQPERLDLRSHDIATEKQQELLRLFPEICTEGGKIDFDRLRRVLGEIANPGKERYAMNWAGKADCFKAIQNPSLGTLLPRRDDSVDFDISENLIIEGDNLEVLKLLQKAYLGKIKMIYIDPPYNTGNDFIYPDNYAESLQTYLEYTGQVDSEGRKFSTNTEADGRFHSKWLNMMYPRLYLARNLLRDDGVLFVSIDDNEVQNLRRLCDEIFGEDQFLAQIVVQSNKRGQTYKEIAKTHEYLIVYTKTDESELNELKKDADKLPFTDSKGAFDLWELRNRNPKFGRFNRPNLFFPIYVAPALKDECGYSRVALSGSADFKVKVVPLNSEDKESCWRWGTAKISASDLTSSTPALVAKQRKDGEWNIYERSRKSTTKAKSIWTETEFISEQGTIELGNLGLADCFDHPKPIALIKKCIQLGSGADDIILDFFAGSGVLGHAVMELNAQEGDRRRFILVQLPEPTRSKAQDGTWVETAASKAGFTSIAKITEERVRRAIKKINEEASKKLPNHAASAGGFRVFGLASSNFRVWSSGSSKTEEGLIQQLEFGINHIIDGRTQEDLLYEMLLKSGFSLAAPVTKSVIAEKTVYGVAEGALLVCLERQLSLELVAGLAGRKPQRVILLDEGFAGNDQLKANAVQIMKSKGVTSFRTV
jgi:adenine-specific DNA-methyltransferase